MSCGNHNSLIAHLNISSSQSYDTVDVTMTKNLSNFWKSCPTMIWRKLYDSQCSTIVTSVFNVSKNTVRKQEQIRNFNLNFGCSNPSVRRTTTCNIILINISMKSLFFNVVVFCYINKLSMHVCISYPRCGGSKLITCCLLYLSW